MVKRLFVIVLLIIIEQIAYAQCIDHEKITTGYTFSNYKHSRYVYNDTITFIEVYYFDADGKVYGISGNGDYPIKDVININQAAANAQKYRTKVENAIKAYAGNRFFSALHFELTTFAYAQVDNGHSKMGALYEKTNGDFRYIYSYDFRVDSMSSCEFRFEADRFGKVLPRFDFPSKGSYMPINKHFTYCQLISIARKTQKHIEPISSIQLNYNVDSKRFCWVILRDISNESPGGHYCYEVQIDATDLSKVKQKRQQCVVFPVQPVK